MSMGVARMLDQNVYFWLVSGLRHGISGELTAQDWSNVKVMMGYPGDVESVALPSIAIVRESQLSSPFEIGSSTKIDRTDTYSVSVFASRDGQRDDLAEYVKDVVDNRVKPFLDFNDGFGDMDGQSQLGKIYFEFVGMFPVRDDKSQMKAGTHRMDVRFTTEYVYDIS